MNPTTTSAGSIEEDSGGVVVRRSGLIDKNDNLSVSRRAALVVATLDEGGLSDNMLFLTPCSKCT